jgi:hypothetical protein
VLDRIWRLLDWDWSSQNAYSGAISRNYPGFRISASSGMAGASGDSGGPIFTQSDTPNGLGTAAKGLVSAGSGNIVSCPSYITDEGPATCYQAIISPMLYQDATIGHSIDFGQ